MYSNIRIYFFYIAILSLIYITKSDYASAIRAGCPFRNGRVYIAYPNMNTITGNRKIIFDTAMTKAPDGVIFGIRTLQTHTVNNFLYYYFLSSELKQTGFNMIINLTSTSSISYSKLIVDYLVAFNVYRLVIYSQYPILSPSIKKTIKVGILQHRYELNTNKEQCKDKQKKLHLFIYELRANFNSNNYQLQVDVNGQKNKCYIYLTTKNSSLIQKVSFSGIIYTSGIKSRSQTNQNYLISNQEIIFDTTTKQININHLPFPTLFVGLQEILSSNSNKIDFTFQYDSQYEFFTNNNFNYFQFNPRDKIKMSQGSSGSLSYQVCIIFYQRQSCDDNFPILNSKSQLCYNKYAPSQGICKTTPWYYLIIYSCFHYGLTEDCRSACAIQSCISPEIFFNITTFRCENCSIISNCLQCGVSGTTLICKKCSMNYALIDNKCDYCPQESYLVSPYSCQPCNLLKHNCSNCQGTTFCSRCTCTTPASSCQSLSNCSSCYYFDNILKCVECNSPKIYLANGRCHACNQDQYFNLIQCKPCSWININCSRCIFVLEDLIECTVCVNKTILNESSCSPCKPEQYFNQTSFSCLKCNQKILNCTQCVVHNEQVNCTKCQNNFDLKSQSICQAKNNCTKLQFFNFTCLPCSDTIIFCETCTYNPTNDVLECDTCLQEQKTVLVNNNTCQKCAIDEFFQNRQCYKCNKRIQNCNICSYTNEILSCDICKQNSVIDNGKCLQDTCNNSQYMNITDSIICEQCSEIIDHCQQCTYQYVLTLTCNTCFDQYILKNNSCISCQQSQYFKNGQCFQCNQSIPNCISCIYQNSQIICSQCEVSYILGYDKCYLNNCIMTQFLQITNISATCKFCNSSISNCLNCLFSNEDLICIGCFTSSETVLIKNQCRSCASYQYYQNNQCYSCTQSLSNCIKCKILDKLICQQCDYESNSQLNQGKCVLCNSTSYLDRQNKQCNSCSNLCIQCSSASNCTKCQEKAANKTNIYLQNGYCNICNSTSKHKNCNIQISCYFSKINQQTGECQPIELTQTAKQSINMIASLPTLNLMSESFVGLVGLFDDLSYYYYHDRKFSTSMTNLLQLMKNASLSRLLMPQLQKMLQNMGINFNFTTQQQEQEPNTFLIHDLGKSPRKFKQNDNDVYFSKTSFKLWTGAVPTTIATFLIMAFLHYLINKKWQNQWFRKYSYLWMIITGIFGHNIQFISFKCFAQMYQVVPIDVSYNMNLIFCYFALLFITIYSITSIILIINQYKLLDPEYILQQLFYETWKARFIMLNLLKMILGFIHAYFYFNPLIQQMLLFLAFSTKLTIYIVTYKWMKNMFNYISLIIDGFLMLALQVFFLVQVPMIKFGVFHGSLQHIIGQYQILLIALLVINKVFIMIALPLKDLIINQIAKRILQNINLDLADITIVRLRVERQLMKKQQKQIQQQPITQQTNNSSKQFYQNNQSICQSVLLAQSAVLNKSQVNNNRQSKIKKNTRNTINKNQIKQNTESKLNKTNRDSKLSKDKKDIQYPRYSKSVMNHSKNRQIKIKKQNKSHFQPQFIQKQQNLQQYFKKQPKYKNEQSELMKERRSKKIRKKIQFQQQKQSKLSEHNIQIQSINDKPMLKRQNTFDVTCGAQYCSSNKNEIPRNRIIRRINKQQQLYDDYFKQDLKVNMFDNNKLQRKNIDYEIEQM